MHCVFPSKYYNVHSHVYVGTAMKTERITFLGTSEFKAALQSEASAAGISVGELVRRQFERQYSPDEVILKALTAELKGAVAAARQGLAAGLSELQAALRELDHPKDTAA